MGPSRREWQEDQPANICRHDRYRSTCKRSTRISSSVFNSLQWFTYSVSFNKTMNLQIMVVNNGGEQRILFQKGPTSHYRRLVNGIYFAATISEGKRFKSVVLRGMTLCSDISSLPLNPSPLSDESVCSAVVSERKGSKVKRRKNREYIHSSAGTVHGRLFLRSSGGKVGLKNNRCLLCVSSFSYCTHFPNRLNLPLLFS